MAEHIPLRDMSPEGAQLTGRLTADAFVERCLANKDNTEYVRGLLQQRIKSFPLGALESGESPVKDFNAIVAGAKASDPDNLHSLMKDIQENAVQQVTEAVDVLERACKKGSDELRQQAIDPSVGEKALDVLEQTIKETGSFESANDLRSNIGEAIENLSTYSALDLDGRIRNWKTRLTKSDETVGDLRTIAKGKSVRRPSNAESVSSRAFESEEPEASAARTNSPRDVRLNELVNDIFTNDDPSRVLELFNSAIAVAASIDSEAVRNVINTTEEKVESGIRTVAEDVSNLKNVHTDRLSNAIEALQTLKSYDSDYNLLYDGLAAYKNSLDSRSENPAGNKAGFSEGPVGGRSGLHDRRIASVRTGAFKILSSLSAAAQVVAKYREERGSGSESPAGKKHKPSTRRITGGSGASCGCPSAKH